jgi:hypothetical protein
MRSRYDLAKDSSQQNSEGTYYKDIFTIPIQKFEYNDSTVRIALSKKDIERPDILAAKVYTKSEFDDIIFWLNNIGLIFDEEPGETIDIPSKADVEKFYYNNRV